MIVARLASKPHNGEWQERDGEEIETYIARTQRMLDQLMEASNAVDVDAGEVVGVVLQFQVADGHAIYRVSKASPLTLEHVPYSDAWRIVPAHIRGIRKQDVLEQAMRSRAVSALFRSKG